MMRTIRRTLPFALALLACTTATPAPRSGPGQPDDLDSFVAAQMAQRRIAGLSLAIIQDGKIVDARGYGFTELGGTVRVTPTTLFQAGSISKPVAAVGALRLVEQGRLSLDTDVNATLKSWKVPSNEFTAVKPVTLRGLLSHTAGLTVHGFPGYDVSGPMPTVIQVLNGTAPANTAPIRVDIAPGSKWRYSGGGYTVMQQMVVDVAGQPFPEYMRQAVLEPIGMTRSSYEQPLPPELAAQTATGHYQDQRPVDGRWHVYPEMAAAGLWTTPSDLARFAIEIQQAYAGKSSKVLSRDMTRRFLTLEQGGYGLGVAVSGSGSSLMFSHGGRDEGFDASLTASAETGQGLAVMINANDNSGMVGRIIRFVATRYNWPALASTYVPPVASSDAIPLARLQSFAGRYEFTNNNMLTLAVANGRLVTLTSGLPDEEFVPIGGDQFASMDRDTRIAFTRDAAGVVTGLTFTRGTQTRSIPRIGPLVSLLARQSDPEPAVTSRVDATLRLMGSGFAAVATAPGLSPGAQQAFSRAPWPAVAGYRGVTYLGTVDVAGRGIERHGHAVDRVAHYTLTTDRGQRSLLVYVTKDGLITDFDDVVD
jgi:CubicO group peptidase (beta-lactamase class C family)